MRREKERLGEWEGDSGLLLRKVVACLLVFFFFFLLGQVGLVWGRILPTFDDTLSALSLAETGVRRMMNHFMTDMILLIIIAQHSMT